MRRLCICAGRLLQPSAKRHPDDRQLPDRAEIRLERRKPRDVQPDRQVVGAGVAEPHSGARFRDSRRCRSLCRNVFVGPDRRDRNPSGIPGNDCGIFAGRACRPAGLPDLREYSGHCLRHLPERTRRRSACRRPCREPRRPEEHRVERGYACAREFERARPVQSRRVSLADADRRVSGRYGLEQQSGLRDRRDPLPEEPLPGQSAIRPQRGE